MDKPPDDDDSPARIGSSPTIGSGEPAVEVPSTQLVDSHEGFPVSDPRIGTVLADRYLVLRRLGQGGMARVYLARHQIIGRNVAIKILLPHLVEDAHVVRRFVNEARAAGMIGHPNIVESVDIGTTDDGLPFLVLEYLEGTNLADEVRRVGPLPVARAVGIALQVASALAAAHAQSIIHRDLKSENVYLVERDGRADHVKVLDFGISKFAGGAGDQKRFTAQGAVMGTPECMAPEQFVDADAVDARIDVYALGVLLYELLAGRTPFGGIPFPKVMHSIVHDDPPPLVLRRPDVPRELDAVVRRAMAKSRDDRPATMDALYDLLLPFAGPTPPPRFQARKSTPGMNAPMTYRLPPRGAGSEKQKAAAPKSEPGSTLVSGGARSDKQERSTAREGRGAQTDTRSTESATAAPAAARSTSRAGLYAVLTLVVLGAPATYFALRHAGRSTNESTMASVSSGPAAPTASITASASIGNSASISSSSAAPSNVALAVFCPLPGARVTFRGRTSTLPFTEIVAPSAQAEPVEVTAEGHEGRRYFVRVDHTTSLAAKLPAGKAIVVDATAAETEAALGGGVAPVPNKPTTNAAPTNPTPTNPTPTIAPTTTSTATPSAKPSVDISLDR